MEELPAEYMIFEFLQDFSGGIPLFFLALNAYVSDISEPKCVLKTPFIRIAFALYFLQGSHYKTRFVGGHVDGR